MKTEDLKQKMQNSRKSLKKKELSKYDLEKIPDHILLKFAIKDVKSLQFKSGQDESYIQELEYKVKKLESANMKLTKDIARFWGDPVINGSNSHKLKSLAGELNKFRRYNTNLKEVIRGMHSRLKELGDNPRHLHEIFQDE